MYGFYQMPVCFDFFGGVSDGIWNLQDIAINSLIFLFLPLNSLEKEQIWEQQRDHKIFQVEHVEGKEFDELKV